MYLIDVEELDESICMLCGSKVCYPWTEPEDTTAYGEQLTLEESCEKPSLSSVSISS